MVRVVRVLRVCECHVSNIQLCQSVRPTCLNMYFTPLSMTLNGHQSTEPTQLNSTQLNSTQLNGHHSLNVHVHTVHTARNRNRNRRRLSWRGERPTFVSLRSCPRPVRRQRLGRGRPRPRRRCRLPPTRLPGRRCPWRRLRPGRRLLRSYHRRPDLGAVARPRRHSGALLGRFGRVYDIQCI